jgi:hypothetical protein
LLQAAVIISSTASTDSNETRCDIRPRIRIAICSFTWDGRHQFL